MSAKPVRLNGWMPKFGTVTFCSAAASRPRIPVNQTVGVVELERSLESPTEVAVNGRPSSRRSEIR